jgi:hypothetical protein
MINLKELLTIGAESPEEYKEIKVRAGTQKARLMRKLLDGETVNFMTCQRLASKFQSRIYELIDMGFDIRTLKREGVNSKGELFRYKDYFIPYDLREEYELKWAKMVK